MITYVLLGKKNNTIILIAFNRNLNYNTYSLIPNNMQTTFMCLKTSHSVHT